MGAFAAWWRRCFFRSRPEAEPPKLNLRMEEDFFFDLMLAMAEEITEECRKPGPRREALERAFETVSRDLCMDGQYLIVNRQRREDIRTDETAFYVFRWGFLFGNYLAFERGLSFKQAILKDELH